MTYEPQISPGDALFLPFELSFSHGAIGAKNGDQFVPFRAPWARLDEARPR